MSEHPINALARTVQRHVPEQPWGRRGNIPVPVELTFDHGEDTGQPARWTVRFVTGLKNGKRQWGYASGPTVEAALEAARRTQREAR